MNVKPITALAVSVLVCLVGVVTTMATGLWTTESTKIPKKFDANSQLNGQYRADDIRGSYTFKEIESLYGVPLLHLAEAFGVSEEQAQTFACKELETIFANSEFEIGTGSVRMFVAFYLGQPYALTEASYLTEKGANIVETFGKPTQEQKEYLATHTIATQNQSQDNSQEKTPVPSNKASLPRESSVPSSGPLQTANSQTINVQGSSYLKDLAKTYDIPLGDFAEAFLLNQAQAENFQVKDIKEKFLNHEAEIGTSSVKIFIAFYKGIPYELAEMNAYLTEAGAKIVQEKGSPLKEQIAYLQTHTAK